MLSKFARLPRVFHVLLVCLAVPAFVLMFGLASVLFERCENTRLRELVAPGREWKLVLFERQCSGTVSWTTHASIVRESVMLPDAPGNVFISYERHGPLIGQTAQEPEVGAQWLSAQRVELTYSADIPVHFVAKQVDSVQVTSRLIP